MRNFHTIALNIWETGTDLNAIFSSFTGACLVRVGQTEQSLGESERRYIRGGHDAIIAPLQVEN